MCLLISISCQSISISQQNQPNDPSKLSQKLIQHQGIQFLEAQFDFKDINALWISFENEMKFNQRSDLDVIKWQQRQLDLWPILKRAESFGLDSQRLSTVECQSFNGYAHLKAWLNEQAQSSQKIGQNRRQEVLYRCTINLPIQSFEKWQNAWQNIISNPEIKPSIQPIFQNENLKVQWFRLNALDQTAFYQNLNLRTQWHSDIKQVSLVFFKFDQQFYLNKQNTLDLLEEKIQAYLPITTTTSVKPLDALFEISLDFAGISDLIANLQLQAEDLSLCETKPCPYLKCFESISYILQRFSKLKLSMLSNQFKMQIHIQSQVLQLWKDAIFPLWEIAQNGLMGISLSLSPQAMIDHALKNRLNTQSCDHPSFQIFQMIDRFPLGLSMSDFAIPLHLLKLFSLNTSDQFDTMGIHLFDLSDQKLGDGQQDTLPNAQVWWLAPAIDQPKEDALIQGLIKSEVHQGLRWHLSRGIDFYYQILKNPLYETKSFYQISLMQAPTDQLKISRKDEFLRLWIDFVQLRSKSVLWQSLSYRQILDFLVQHFKQVQLTGSLKQETLQYLFSWERL